MQIHAMDSLWTTQLYAVSYLLCAACLVYVPAVDCCAQGILQQRATDLHHIEEEQAAVAASQYRHGSSQEDELAAATPELAQKLKQRQAEVAKQVLCCKLLPGTV